MKSFAGLTYLNIVRYSKNITCVSAQICRTKDVITLSWVPGCAEASDTLHDSDKTTALHSCTGRPNSAKFVPSINELIQEQKVQESMVLTPQA